MNRLLIYEYINRLRYEDIVNFCNIKGISVNECDINTVYNYIKSDYKRFFDNPDLVLHELKNKVSNNAYSIIVELYNKYKKFI